MFLCRRNKLPKNSWLRSSPGLNLQNQNFDKRAFSDKVSLRFEDNLKKEALDYASGKRDGNTELTFGPVMVARKAAEYMETKSFSLALEEYLKLITLVPASPLVLTAIASCYINLGKAEEGESFLEKALEADSQYGPALLEKAKLYIKMANLTAANAILERVVKYYPEDFEARLLIAANHLLYQDFEPAIKIYNEILSMNDSNREAHAGLGIIYYGQKNWKDAFSEFYQALGEKEDNAPLLSKCASCLMLLKRYDEAWIYVEKAIALDPDMFLSYLPRGQMNFLKHRFQEAIDDLTKFMEYSDLLAVNMSPENLLIHQIQKSDLLLSIADSRLNLFVDKYPTLRPFFEKKGKEMSENYYAKKEKRRKELKPGEMENLFPHEEVDEGAMTEAKMKELQYRIKLTYSDELARSFVEFCEARSVHYEAKEIVDSYLRLMRDTIDEFLRTQF